MKSIEFDRSRSETWQKCPRKRFLEYEYPTGEKHNGLMRREMAVPLLSGGTVHRGIEVFLNGNGILDAVAVALEQYDTAIEERGIEIDELAPQTEWVVKVQRALIEALVVGWVRYVWPRIDAEFEVVDVEREERAVFPHLLLAPMGEGQLGMSAKPDVEIVLMARTDLLLKRKLDGHLFVRNYKTINEPQLRKLEAFRYDTQTISEVLAVEQRIQNEWTDNTGMKGYPNVDGVIYDLLVKGARKQEYPRKSGVWHNNSELIWCWKREGQTGVTDDAFAVKWNYTCQEPHQMGKKLCMGGENHTLGKGWERKLVTDVFPGGVVGWMDWLEANEPGLAEAQFISMPAIMRSPYDVEVWKRSILNQELEIARKADEARYAIGDLGFTDALPILDHDFPKHTAAGNCFFPSKCPMFGICWGTDGQGEPTESENYMVRESNHPEGVAIE